jgi:hypothetical protein
MNQQVIASLLTTSGALRRLPGPVHDLITARILA